MLLTDSRTARVLLTVLLFALGLGFLYVTRQTLIAFLFAIFFAYLVSPMVSRLEKVLRGGDFFCVGGSEGHAGRRTIGTSLAHAAHQA